MLQHQLQPAAYVLECLGVRNLARKLGLASPTVSNWNRPPGTSESTQSGTGGYIPAHYWEIIADIAQEAGYRHITREFLASKSYPELRVTAPSKLKGDRYERETVEALIHAGLRAQRVPLSGAAPGYPGDIYLYLGHRTVLCQCKISKTGEGYTIVSRMLKQACFGRVETESGSFYAMHFLSFIRYLKDQAGYLQTFCHMPVLTTKGKTFTDAIMGHEILFYRRDRGDTYVIVPAAASFG